MRRRWPARPSWRASRADARPRRWETALTFEAVRTVRRAIAAIWPSEGHRSLVVPGRGGTTSLARFASAPDSDRGHRRPTAGRSRSRRRGPARSGDRQATPRASSHAQGGVNVMAAGHRRRPGHDRRVRFESSVGASCRRGGSSTVWVEPCGLGATPSRCDRGGETLRRFDDVMAIRRRGCRGAWPGGPRASTAALRTAPGARLSAIVRPGAFDFSARV